MSCFLDCCDPLDEEKTSRHKAEAEAPPSLCRTWKQRTCTDAWAILLYLLSWGGLIAILVVASKKGADPQRVIRGVDFQGRICGVSDGVKDQPLAAWIAMPLNLVPGVDCTDCYQIMTCVSACNETLSHPLMVDHYASEQFLYYCVAGSDGWAYNAQFQSASALATRTFADLYTCWRAILISACAALLVSFMYTWFSKGCAGWLVVLACLCTVAGGVIVTWALFSEAAFKADTASSNQATALQIVGAFTGVSTLVFVCILFAIRRELVIAVSLVKEGSKAILKMPWLLVFPLLPTLVGLGYFVFFVVTTVIVCSVWETTPALFPSYITQKAPALYGNTAASGALYTQFSTHTINQALLNSFAYLFLHMLWSISICTYFSFTVVGSSVGRWYFSQALQPRLQARSYEDKRKFKKKEQAVAKAQGVYLSETPVTDACLQTLRFHMGTVILAALIMSLLNMLRAFTTYLQAKASAGRDLCCVPYRCQSACFCIINCCVQTTTCCVTQVNQFTLLWMGVFGTDFFVSAQGSFALIFGNLAHAAVLSMVGSYLTFCGKLFVAAATTGVAALVLPSAYPQLNSLILPLVAIFLVAYLAASAFMTVLDTSIDAVFFAFLCDEHANASSGAMHASARLQALIYRDKKESGGGASTTTTGNPISMLKVDRASSTKKAQAQAQAQTNTNTKTKTKTSVKAAPATVTTKKGSTKKKMQVARAEQIDLEIV